MSSLLGSWHFKDFLEEYTPHVLRSQYLCGDMSFLPAVARAIWGLKSIFGTIPNMFAVGRNVKRLAKLEEYFHQHYGKPKHKSGEISHLFIFERDLDWTSCLLSPLTYEGLLDETFGISCGTVEFGPEVTKTEGGSTKLQLSSRDKMFDKIRNKHFASIFSVLGVTAKQLSAAQAAASSMSVSEMKQFVANDLKAMKAQSKAVALHISASEAIQREKGSHFESQLPVEHALVSCINYKENISFIEDSMALLKPMIIPLRLICLLSHCSGGLTLLDYQKLKTQFIQAYGFQHLITWNNLVKMGIISVKGGLLQSSSQMEKSTAAVNKIPGIVSQHVVGLVGGGKGGNFQQIVKKLNLIPADTSLTEPSNAGYVFNGAYSPLTCRLVEEVLKAGGDVSHSPAVGELLKLLPGESVIEWSGNTANKVRNYNFIIKEITTHCYRQVAMVLFVGGFTIAEVAAFRWLQTVTGYQFIIAGTGLCSGNKLITDLEKL